MHAFAIAVGLPEVTAGRLAAAVGEVARQFWLDPATAWRHEAADGSLVAAGVHHGASATPRRYLHRDARRITLWEFLARDRVRGLLDADTLDRRPQLEGLLRAATVFWYFHGPEPS